MNIDYPNANFSTRKTNTLGDFYHKKKGKTLLKTPT